MSRKSGKSSLGDRRPRGLASQPEHPSGTSYRFNLAPVATEAALSNGRPPSLLYPGAAGLAAGLFMILLSLLSVNMATRAPSVAMPPTNSSDNSIGSADAPVVITEWIDFQCPSCRLFALTREPDIRKKYVDTGQVRIVSRNLAFLGQESVLAAEAADAAAAQGRYWDYRTLLFQRQNGENRGTFTLDTLKRYAAELGLDQQPFNDALDNGTYRAAVQAEQNEGRAQHINATPTVIVNGRTMDGVPTVDALSKAIDQELAKRK